MKPHLLLALLLACDATRTYSGEHVDLVVDPGLVPCGDLVGHMDRYVALAAERWGFDLTGVRLTYAWLSRGNFIASDCPDNLTGCARGTLARSYLAPYDHELLHLVAVGNPPRFFIEGAAVAFELRNTTPGPYLNELPDAEDLAASMVDTDPSAAQYRLAGGYTRLLIDRFGLPAYRDFYASLDRSADLDEIAAAHADIFAEPLTDTIAVFDAERRTCPFSSFNLKIFECAGEPIAWHGDVLTTHHDLSCAGDEAVGPFFDAHTRVYATFLVDRPGLFDLSIASDPSSAGFMLASCGGCEAPPPLVLRAGEGPRHISLDAGAYYVLFTGSLTTDVTASLRLERIAER